MLARNCIGPEGVQALAAAAPHWPHMQALDLSMNDFGSDGARELVGAAPSWQQLLCLNLSQCELGPQGARHVAAAAQIADHGLGEQEASIANSDMTQLQYFNLGRNSVGLSGIKAVVNAGQHWYELQHLA